MTEDRKILGVYVPYFGCGDPFGENKPEDVGVDEIIKICKDYNMDNDNIGKILNHIVEMCNTSYGNGYESANFDNSENC